MYIAQPIEWTDRGVVMLDQRLLPTEEVHYTYTTYQEVAAAIGLNPASVGTLISRAQRAFRAEFVRRYEPPV